MLIKELSLYLSNIPGSAQDFESFKIKMINTTTESFTNSGDFIDLSSETPVFQRSNYDMTSTGWNMWDIDDFSYDGNNNLLIEISWGQNTIPAGSS